MDIVILGAGYGGMSCVTRLSRRFRKHPQVRIHLVDRHTYHLLETRLHERAVRESEVTLPLARFLAKRENVTFHFGEVTHIALNERYVELDFGMSDTSAPNPRRIRYDHLVIALGSKTNFYQIPGSNSTHSNSRNSTIRNVSARIPSACSPSQRPRPTGTGAGSTFAS